MYLIGLQALNTEYKYMAWAVHYTRTLPFQVEIKGAIVDCLLLKCINTEDERSLRERVTQWLPHGDVFAKVKSIKDTTHIKLKERDIQMRQSSWLPNYEAVENDTLRFDSDTYGNWHTHPRFKYTRVWREIVEDEGIGTCDETRHVAGANGR